MKNVVFFLTILSITYGFDANAQSWQWGRSPAGGSFEVAYSSKADQSGNIYIAGAFTNATLTLDTTVLHNAGGSYTYDLFLAKYDSAGNVLWAKRAGSIKNDWAFAVTTDADNNVIIAGDFSSPTISFDTITLTNADTSGTTTNVFVAKYDSSGNVLWAKNTGGHNTGEAFAVTTNAGGEIFVTGWFSGTTIAFDTTTLTNAGGNDVFIAKFDAVGHAIWAKRGGGSLNDYGSSVAVDVDGNIYIAGQYTSDTAYFGSTSVINTAVGNQNEFLVKYDTSGNALWARTAMGSVGSAGTFRNSVAANKSRGIYISNSFTGRSIIFGTDTLYNADTSGVTSDIYIVLYDNLGNLQWAKRAGGSGSDVSNCLVTDQEGNFYLAGAYGSPTIDFGVTTLVNPGSSLQTFLVQYDATGAAQWAATAGTTLASEPYGLTVSPSGSTYITGYYRGSGMTFSPFSVSNTGIDNIFFAKSMNAPSLTKQLVSSRSNLIVWPNPSTDQLNFCSVWLGNISGVEITDILGRQVFYQNINASGKSTQIYFIALPCLPDGIYYLRAFGKDGSESVPFVVKR